MDNRLVLNDGKTEVMHIRSVYKKKTTDLWTVRIGTVDVATTVSVRDLGVFFSNRSDMIANISNICRSGSFALYRIGRIRNILDRTSTEKLIHAFVTSRLDYCNSLLFGVEDKHLHKLQVIQNSAARIITRTRMNEHITPVRRELHWLPIHARIEYKILLFVYKILHDVAPSYLSDLVSVKEQVRVLRSNASGAPALEPADWEQVHFGYRSFANAAPTLWNVLPPDVRMSPTITAFKSSLKTHLFRKYY